MPGEAESNRLLGLFNDYMSGNQHFIDQRTFADNLTLLFQNQATRAKQMKTPWFTLYLLVMAMGKLMEADRRIYDGPPGAFYFAEAMKRFPPLHSISEYGIVGVEILCLATTYLQWCDRKKDSYFFVRSLPRFKPVNGGLSQGDLIKKMRNVLQSLYDTGRSIPLNIAIDFKSKELEVTRSGSSLYLRLFSAIILCIRPILLQKVKDKVQDTQKQIVTPAISQLCLLCNEAALRTIRILYAMKKQDEIAPFAFFDLDAAFSAAFVLIMRGFAHKNDSQKPPPQELHQAVEVLEYLSAAGNNAASHRLKEIKQLEAHVWGSRYFPPEKDGDVQMKDSGTPHGEPHAGGSGAQGTTGQSGEGSGSQVVLSPPDPSPSTQPSWDGEMFGTESAESYDPDQLFGLDLNGSLGQEFSLEAEGIYASFNDPTLPLTGVDQLDWAELEKMMAPGGYGS
ncbi:hypothetical protein COL922a_013082 [Colletotrichum nupharicola]|nr:hypothetical protein COL922a_013082 [Colletotrichum nupharicola]